MKHVFLVEENYFLFGEQYFDNVNGFRVLKKCYVVHHKDGNHDNNALSNLQVLTRGEHTRIHNLGRKLLETKKDDF